MATTYSTSLKLALIGDGDQSGIWGQTTNTNLGTLVEQAITGVTSITMTDANYTLTSFNGITDEARSAVLVVNGSNNAIRNVIPPLVKKLYTVTNNTAGGYGIRIIGSSGTGVVIPNGATCLVYCDGVNFYNGLTGSAGSFTVSGDLSTSGNASVTGALSGTTATFSGAISSVSPAFTGTPTAPTAAAGTNTTQIATTAFVNQNSIVTGSLLMWPTGSAPTGYLLCDGTPVSRSTYAALFAIIGTTFGSGDGLTTFNLPDYRDRMPIGSGTIAASIGTTGGSKDAIVVSHTHTATSSVTDPGHTHSSNGNNFLGNYAGGGINVRADIRSYGMATVGVNSATTGVSVATTVASAGSSGTNANLPPYLGINFIIKT
jgi:microcystin-dependent protein